MSSLILNANALAIPLADQSVQCVVTSPPYYGLRDYGVSDQLGLEQTPEAYVANMVAVFRECKRILRDDGTLWVNIGDSYARDPAKVGNGHPSTGKQATNKGSLYDYQSPIPNGLKQKDLIGIPWMLAFALRADGWYLRQDIIWAKPNPMPESVKDRCTKSHEYIFLLSKSQKYYFDNEAIKEPAAYDGRKDEQFKGAIKSYDGVMPNGQPQSFAQNGHPRWNKDVDGNRVRNKRDVWTVTTKPYKGAHYATFNPELIKPCILAGAPETCCAKCGAPYKRVVEHKTSTPGQKPGYAQNTGMRNDGDRAGGWTDMETKTLDFQPTCTCNAGTSSGIVFDPFVGSGTTVATAIQLGRKGIGLDLSLTYLYENAKDRIKAEMLPLLTLIKQSYLQEQK
jgi:DNA modification methylase